MLANEEKCQVYTKENHPDNNSQLAHSSDPDYPNHIPYMEGRCILLIYSLGSSDSPLSIRRATYIYLIFMIIIRQTLCHKLPLLCSQYQMYTFIHYEF